jgi:ABC-type molybdenum transport system ATPase subunit/photorepair protein PhrA
MNIETEAVEVQRLAARIELLDTTYERNNRAVETAKSTLLRAQAAQEILQLIAQAVQQQVHAQISEVVSSCLAAVFEDPYEFKIVFERKRGRTEAVLRFLRRGLDVDPLTASGGGMIDVAAFALRVAALVLHRPRLSRVVVLDEAFKFVSSQYRENVRSMLEQLSDDMGVQIIQVTHIEELETGKVIYL